MDNYTHGFVINFVYCKKCLFYLTNYRHSTFPLVDDVRFRCENLHDSEQEKMIANNIQSEPCPKRQLVISYTQVIIENETP